MIRPLLRSLGRLLLVLFVLWHMSAIALYALPWDAPDRYTQAVRKATLPYIQPYILTTSQWQQWNLFSPDPIRRVTHYVIEAEIDGEWVQLARLQPGSFPWWRHASQFKLLSEVLEGDSSIIPIAERYMQRFCVQKNVPAGTPLRLAHAVYVIPKPDRPMPVSWWKQQVPEFRTTVGLVTSCFPVPSVPAPSA